METTMHTLRERTESSDLSFSTIEITAGSCRLDTLIERTTIPKKTLKTIESFSNLNFTNEGENDLGFLGAKTPNFLIHQSVKSIGEEKNGIERKGNTVSKRGTIKTDDIKKNVCSLEMVDQEKTGIDTLRDEQQGWTTPKNSRGSSNNQDSGQDVSTQKENDAGNFTTDNTNMNDESLINENNLNNSRVPMIPLPAHRRIITNRPTEFRISRPRRIAPPADIEESFRQIQEPTITGNNSTPEEIAIEQKKAKLNQILRNIAKYRYFRALALSVALLLEAIFLFFLVEGTSSSHRECFIVCYVYLSYNIIENAIRALSPNILRWKNIESWFDIFDFIGITVFMMLVDLRLSGFDVLTKYGLPLPVINLGLYLWKSKAPKALKECQFSVKLLYFFQLVLFAGKIDDDFNWSWQTIFCFIWVYLACIGILCLSTGLTFVVCLFSFAVYRKKSYPDISYGTQIFGFLWMALYSGLGVSIFFALLGIKLGYDSEKDPNRGHLKGSLILMGILSILVIVIQVIVYRWIILFLIRFNLDEYDYKSELGLLTIGDNGPKVVREKKSVYLFRVSSTYFSFLDRKRARKKDKDALIKLKKSIVHARRKPKASTTNPEEKAQIHSHRTLKTEPEKQTQNILCDQPHFWSLREKADEPNGDEKLILSKLCFSDGNKTYETPKNDANDKEQNENENVCYICYSELPNAVIEGCGHGGVCIECAIQIIKNQGQCMECRKEARRAIKIDPNPRMKDLIKGSEIITVIPTEKGFPEEQERV